MTDYYEMFDEYAASIERYYGNVRGKNGKRMTPDQLVAWHERQRDDIEREYKAKPPKVTCENCHQPPTGTGEYPQLCDKHAKAAADYHAAKQAND